MLIIAMIARNAQGSLASVRDDLGSLLASVVGLLGDERLEDQAEDVQRKGHAILTALGESQLRVKEELLALREENLGLRKSVWDHERKDMDDPLEAINARIKLEDIVRMKEEEINNLKDAHEVGQIEPGST